MELKSYQQDVINDLSDFIDKLEQTEQLNKAYSQFWESKGIMLNSLETDFLKPYDNSIVGVPRVTVKVPTAGGKTFIACNALKTIFDSFPSEKSKVVAWFVPSDTILKQTYKNLSDPAHPYRQKIDSHFGSAVSVFDKEQLLFGQGFNPVEIKEQLNIFVLSVQSFASKNKEGRRVYRENENLAEFPKTYTNPNVQVSGADETALIQVIAQLNPVVIIDESHNFEADLRIDMLNSINPSFILDLTATPREKSNIISFVDAIKLKQNNMVKLPVIVYNHQTTSDVIISAIQLQKTLETKAKEQEEKGGKYIRPIVLFQAQPKTDDDNITFDKIKEQLIEIGIPENQIRIKTAKKDEIKNEDLMSRECEVRFIITVNALKEGWDCPFAYILASLANKSSAVDVEQILGRILRQPYVTKHPEELLNLSYVFTSSANFLQTLDKILLGLNKAGFSRKDYRAKDLTTAKTETPETAPTILEELFKPIQPEPVQPASTQPESMSDEIEIDIENIKEFTKTRTEYKNMENIVELAMEESSEYNKTIKELENENNILPAEIMEKVKQYPIKDVFKDEADDVKLPSFFYKVKEKSMFEQEGSLVSLTKNQLLQGFNLSTQDSNINFSRSSSEMVKIDLVEGKKDEYVPEYRKVSDIVKEEFAHYFNTLTPEGKINQIAGKLAKNIRKMDEISEPDLIAYIKKVLQPLSSEKITQVLNDDYFYANLIKKKIISLTDAYAEKKFSDLLDMGDIVCEDSFELPKSISPKNTLVGITKNLYVEEGEMNDFERRVILEVANLDNVVFWHRNLERGKGFMINGFINHYPDFIVKMKNGKIILIETKGDHLDGSDSLKKLELGKKWESKAGDKYRYFMVFDNNGLSGAKTLSELITILKGMN